MTRDGDETTLERARALGVVDEVIADAERHGVSLAFAFQRVWCGLSQEQRDMARMMGPKVKVMAAARQRRFDAAASAGFAERPREVVRYEYVEVQPVRETPAPETALVETNRLTRERVERTGEVFAVAQVQVLAARPDLHTRNVADMDAAIAAAAKPSLDEVNGLAFEKRVADLKAQYDYSDADAYVKAQTAYPEQAAAYARWVRSGRGTK